MFVKQLLVDRWRGNGGNGGLKVTTTLIESSTEAEKIVAEEMKKWLTNITNGAVIVLEPESGEILAMVGSRDYNELILAK